MFRCLHAELLHTLANESHVLLSLHGTCLWLEALDTDIFAGVCTNVIGQAGQYTYSRIASSCLVSRS